MTRRVKNFRIKLPNQHGTPSIVKSDTKNISRDENFHKNIHRITDNGINKN